MHLDIKQIKIFGIVFLNDIQEHSYTYNKYMYIYQLEGAQIVKYFFLWIFITYTYLTFFASRANYMPMRHITKVSFGFLAGFAWKLACFY